MPTGPHGSSQPDGSRQVQKQWGEVSLFTLLLPAYSSHVIMRGTGCIFQEPDSSAVGIFPHNPSNFPFDTLRLEGPGISIPWGYTWKAEVVSSKPPLLICFWLILVLTIQMLWLFLPLAVICLVRHMACPGCCTLTAESGILGYRLPTQTGLFHSPPALLPAFSCAAALLWDCIPNHNYPSSLTSAWMLFHYISKPLFITSFLRQWWARWMESVNTKVTSSSYPDQNINKYKYIMNFPAICVLGFFISIVAMYI